MEPSLEPYWANFTKIYSMPTLFPLIFAIQRIELPGLGSNSSIFLANIVLAVYFWLGPLNGSITGRYLWRRSDFFLNLHHRLLFPPHLHLRLSSSTSTSSSSSSSSTSSSSSSSSWRSSPSTTSSSASTSRRRSSSSSRLRRPMIEHNAPRIPANQRRRRVWLS